MLNILFFSYANCSLTKYMDRHKIKPDSKAFNLVRDRRYATWLSENAGCEYCVMCELLYIVVSAAKTADDGSE